MNFSLFNLRTRVLLRDPLSNTIQPRSIHAVPLGELEVGLETVRVKDVQIDASHKISDKRLLYA